MNGPDQNPTPGAREARCLFLVSLGASVFILAIYVLHLFPRISAPSAFALPPILAVCLYLAVRLACAGGATAPARWVVPGFFFIVGGAAFDMAATVLHTPDLRQENNPIARALLDSGYPVAAVYGLAAVGQTMYVALICALWAALLKHRSFLLISLREVRSPLAFFKAATGGGERTWRQWLCPLRRSELPDASYAVWIIAVVLIASGVERWYLGFEWYGFVSGLRVLVVVCSILIGLCIYLAWLWWASRTRANGSC